MPITTNLDYDNLAGQLLGSIAYGTNPWFREDYVEPEVLRQPTKLENAWETAKGFIPFGNLIDKWKAGEYSAYPEKSPLPDIIPELGNFADIPAALAKTPFALGAIMGSKIKDIFWPKGWNIPKVLVPKATPQTVSDIFDITHDAAKYAQKEGAFDANQLEKVLATTRRTADSLMRSEDVSPKPYLDALGYGKFFLDIPVAAIEKKPLPIRADTPNVVDLARMMKIADIQTPIRGFYFAPGNIMMYGKQFGSRTAPHELLHWAASKTVEPEKKNLTRRAFAKLTEMYPEEAAMLKEYPSYVNYSPEKLGEEMLARIHAKQIGRPFYFNKFIKENPTLKGLMESADEAFSPSMILDAIDDFPVW